MVRSQAPVSVTIAAFARAGNVGVETVRYYQRRGLLDDPARRSRPPARGAIRRYGTGDIERLRFIRSAQSAGFTLEEIRALLRLDATRDRDEIRALADRRIAALDLKIRDLQAARNALKKLSSRCSTSGSGPCPIVEAFHLDDRA
ncbi:MAG TPA: MerR family DNA-binding protein [Steroidobacteraceae bacterium]|jgi:MerR family mercuric resistance operon transcriptional regulator|nr:MerR family DNA-binding protein [Steroidobacteraceae bacterium]